MKIEGGWRRRRRRKVLDPRGGSNPTPTWELEAVMVSDPNPKGDPINSFQQGKNVLTLQKEKPEIMQEVNEHRRWMG